MVFAVGKFWTGKNGKIKLLAVVLIIAVFVLFIIFVNDETTSTVNKSKDSDTKNQTAVITPLILTNVNLNGNNKSKISPTPEPPQIPKEGCGIGGDPVIDINQKIINDYDLDNNRKAWAIDSYEQNIKIWKRPENNYTYCAEQNLIGTFDAIAGKTSPGDKIVTMAGIEDGVLVGSSRVMIVGILKEKPGRPLTGTLETADYKCIYDNNCSSSNSHLWPNIYFTNIAYGYPKTDWWVWNYKNGDHVWINSNRGNYGDVL